MAEVKPCPFCGRTPTVDDCGDHRYFVRCKCGIAQDKLYMQKCDAVRRWNTRKTLAAAQPQRMRGRWYGPFCSKCGISKYNFVKILHTDDGPCGKWNYCPNCGADMRGEQDETTD